jgi:hypothetical protein
MTGSTVFVFSLSLSFSEVFAGGIVHLAEQQSHLVMGVHVTRLHGQAVLSGLSCNEKTMEMLKDY